VPDRDLYDRFRADLIATTQINGNFYRRLDRRASATGLIWATGTVANAAIQRPTGQIIPFPVKGSSTANPAARTPERATP
jgi:capsular polysaccharide export protein